jgi:RteC protein
MLDQLFLHRIQHLDKYFYPQKLVHIPNNVEYSHPTPKELSAYHSGQLSLFPKESGSTNLKWNRDKVAFVELFISVHESKAILGHNNLPVSKKDFLELLMWFFNIRISQWSRLLNSAMERKIKRESEYLLELSKIYNEMASKRLS